ncbi:MAG TPA: putative metal-binding motif-containing protein [Kofleriaceae bacterium]
MFVAAVGCGSDDPGPLFQEKPECQGEAVTPFAGTQPQVISSLEIGSFEDGFDLDGDGDPDNKLAAVSSIAMSPINEAISNYEILIPFEFFDLAAVAPDTCVKFAIYLGEYVVDKDNDGEKPFIKEGDCNDNVMAIRPGNPEIAGNQMDDDCDGLADETADNTPSADNTDRDGDGQLKKDGDCDDSNNMVKTGMAEICGDGLDNDCDKVADYTFRGEGMTAVCSPYDPATNAEIPLDPLSFVAGGAPAIIFKDGVITEQDGKMVLDAGPSVFGVNIPVIDDLALELRITGAQIKADVVMRDGAIVLENGRLGGVIDAKTADVIRGLDVEMIGLKPEDSLLDATFANLLGPILALPKASVAIQKKYDGCRTPDIDVDRDGLEAYCDSNVDDDIKTVDICIDGDGTEVHDVLAGDGTVLMHCTEAMAGTKERYVDGISVALKFATSKVKALKPPL